MWHILSDNLDAWSTAAPASTNAAAPLGDLPCNLAMGLSTMPAHNAPLATTLDGWMGMRLDRGKGPGTTAVM